MSAVHPFRFGAGSEGFIPSRAAWDSLVRRAEALGYSIFLVSDHFTNGFTTIAALLAAADAAKTIRIGSYVFDNDFRHPIQLAKEVATLDLLSGGRFELGIGAGWDKAEYDQVGLVFDRPGVRIERLAEAITILKQFFTQESVTFAGNHYRVTGLKPLPQSPQRPHPPIFIGGGGERMLRLAGQEADIVGITPKVNADGTVDASERTEAALERKVAWIRESAGERYAALEVNVQIHSVVITPDRQQAAEELIQGHAARSVAPGMTATGLLANPYWLIGSVDQVVGQVRRLREAYGISYFMVDYEDMEAFAPVVAQLAGT